MKEVKFKFFELDNGNYAVFPVGNHVEKSIIITNQIGREICDNICTQTKEEIIEMLSQKYNVSKETLYVDLQDFMKKLDDILYCKTEDTLIENALQISEKDTSLSQLLVYNHYKRKIPYNVFFELTYNCNLRCPHCYLQNDLTSTNKYISKEMVFRIVDELEGVEAVNITFTGGEATLHPDIIEILQYASSKNILVTLLTNGQLITDDMLNQLVHIPLYDIRVSLYGTEQQHDSFVKKPGAFAQVKKVLSFLQAKKGIGEATFIMTTQNHMSFMEVVKEFERVNVPVNFSGMILPTADGDLKPTQFRITDKETLKKIYRDSGIALSGSECTAGVCRFRITPTGDVNPCEMMHHVVFGNLHKQSFSDILKSDVHMEWLEFFDKLKKEHNCGKCENKKLCSFCPGLFYEEIGSYDTPSPYTCMITQIKKELMLNE